MNKNFNSKNQKSVLNMQKKINYKFHQEKKKNSFSRITTILKARIRINDENKENPN